MKVTVLMPVYNGEKYLRESISSILDQSFTDFEFIIVDDGSTDRTSDIIKSFNDERIKYFIKENSGIVDSLNFGLDNSSGEFIIRMDADDISETDRIQKLFNFMKSNEDVAICGSWAEKIDEKGETVGEFVYPPVVDKEIRKYIFLHNPFIHPSVVFRREIIKEVGGYKNFKNVEDYELYIRLLKKGKGYNIPEKLIRYRVHSEQVTKKNNFRMRLFGIYVRFLAFINL